MKTIGIYPCNAQPPHRGHFESYKQLRRIAGPDTFVVTTDFDPSIEAPLHFGDKEQILVRHGIPDSHIRQVKNLFNPVEILENYDPETTVVIYGFNQPNTNKLINKSSYYKGLGFAGSQLKPFKYQSYILTIDDSKIGNKIYSSKNIRESLGSHRFTNEQKEKWFRHFFGWFDLGLFELLKNKYTNAHQSDSLVPNPKNDMRETLTKEITDILNELMGQPPSIATDISWGNDNSIATDTQSSTDQTSINKANVQNLVQQEKQAENDKKRNLSQYKRDKDSAYNYDKYLRKQDQEKIDNLKKQIAQPNKTTSTSTTSVTPIPQIK